MHQEPFGGVNWLIALIPSCGLITATFLLYLSNGALSMPKSLNPVIQAIGQHLANGDMPSRIHFDSYRPPYRFTCTLDDGSEHQHEIQASSFGEFQKIAEQARDFWYRIDWPDSPK